MGCSCYYITQCYVQIGRKAFGIKTILSEAQVRLMKDVTY